MRSEDRSALHEALEQQTVSIAKAGIMATLNTRCSVLAAANPKFGRFDRYKSVADQIDLPSPILSRFDLTFVIEDRPNVEKDRALAQHILKIHQSSNVAYEIEPELLRKYIAYARKNINPQLTDEAMKVLEEFYVSVRSGGVEEDTPVPITARQLEAIIRLAEASAKLQLKDKVEASDAHRAINLQRKCLEKVGLDPETGKIDIDKVEGRTPTSDRDRIKKVMDEIGVLEAEFVNVPVDILKEHLAENYEMSGEKVDAILKQLKGKGFIYEPRNGLVKRLEN
jgi:replicative DNA helicase Mcm